MMLSTQIELVLVDESCMILVQALFCNASAGQPEGSGDSRRGVQRMQVLQVVLLMALFNDHGLLEESPVADALMPENVGGWVHQLDDPRFETRDAAAAELFLRGRMAVYPLVAAAQTGSPETSVRAFEILQQLYRLDQESTHESVEQAFQELKHSNNLAAAARAQQGLENNAELRQKRAIAQIERLGGIVNFRDRSLVDRQPLARPEIDYIALVREWVGTEADLQLLSRIEDLRNTDVVLYVIRGAPVSKESLLNLRAELPFLVIESRGPARLGVRPGSSSRDDEGCMIIEPDPGSAADLAGLRANDVIIEIDGQPVGNFKKLVQIIETKEPGDQVELVYRRGPELRDTVAELQPWTKKVRPKESDPAAK